MWNDNDPAQGGVTIDDDHVASAVYTDLNLGYHLGVPGSGDLQWRPDGDHYTLQLNGSAAGLNVLTQVSQGGFDAAGVAPQRFTDQRLRRSPQAANFQREAGKISFSGPSLELPLAPGVQDRLSWMIQLAAVVARVREAAAARGIELGPSELVGLLPESAAADPRALGLESLPDDRVLERRL